MGRLASVGGGRGGVGSGWRWGAVVVALGLGLAGCEGDPRRAGERPVAQRTEALDPFILAEATRVDPPTRHSFVMGELGGRIIAFGGTQGGGYPESSNLTWVYEDGDWRVLTTPASPPWRRGSAMVRFGNELLLFGGRTGSNAYLNDFWRFDGTTWTAVSSANRPSARGHHVMGVLRINNVDRLFLFGGQATSGSLSDTWEWTGTDWVQLTPTVTSASGGTPPSGGGFAMAQAPFQGKLVMYGGWNDQLWEFDGQAWVGRRPATRPTSRVNTQLAVVGTKLVVFGGFSTGNTEVNDVWEWDGTSWMQRTFTTRPRARAEAVALTRNGKLFLHGGNFTRSSVTSGLSDTWEFDGTRWTDLVPTPAPRPSGRRGHAMVNVGDNLLLFGGKDEQGVLNDETWWRWAIFGWVRVEPTAQPSAREYHAMVTVGSRVLLFGGRNGTTALGDTWEWTGTNWEQKSPATSPPARFGHGLAVVGTDVLLFGGSSGTAALGDTWRWDGTTWTQLSPATSPSARQFHGMGSYLGTPMVFAGIVDTNDPQTALSDLWEWTGTTWQLKTPATALTGAYDGLATVEIFSGLLFIPGRVHGGAFASGLIWWGSDFSQVFFQAQAPQSTYFGRHSTAAGLVPGGVLIVGGGSGSYDSSSVAAESWFAMFTPPDAGADGGVDAGVDAGAPTQDAGTPPQDAGTPPQDAGTPEHDAGTGTPPQDAGTPPQDAGTPPQDAGTPPQDAGTPPQDAGTPPQDAGTGTPPQDAGTGTPPQDAGTPSQDAGTPSQDAGTPSQDAGTPSQDAGTPSQDAGTPTQDAGTPTQDAGTPTQDAGTSPDAGIGNMPGGEGCACAGTSPTAAWPLLGLLAQLAWARRRPRRGTAER